MTPTSDERREVAERLRGLARERGAVECSSVAHTLWLAYEAHGTIAAFSGDAVARLSDLIDPTCEVVGDNPYTSDYVFVCKTCHEHFSVASTPRYCPGCGRRIDYGNR